jgi:DNA polymerase III alpha subunit
MIPQLRVRTEFSFRECFGRIGAVADALKRLSCPAAGIVDPGTWGHVQWETALKKQGVKSLFGTEVAVRNEHGHKPVAWVLATDTRKFYNFSTAIRQKDADPIELLRRVDGVVRFAGAALEDPDTFDFVDVNPSSPLSVRRSLRLHAHTGKPLVITSDNWYSSVQNRDSFIAMGGKERSTPQHLLSEDELRAALPQLSAGQFDRALLNCHDIAASCASELISAPMIHYEGDLVGLAYAGKAERLRLGHISKWTDEYEARFQRELEMIKLKEFESYFLVVADLVSWSKKRMLVGPARGSSAGSLICYLLRITEVDPLPYGLLFERFIDVSRSDLPDIDIDFSDKKRELCFSYLTEKYGNLNVARIGSINTLRARSVIARACEKLAIPSKEKFDILDVLIEYSSGDSRYGHSLEDTMAQTEPGKRFESQHPEVKVMFDLENHASHTGVHAAGVIVCNESVSDFCTVGAEGVAQLDKPDSERLNLLKIDVLGLRTLGVIEDAEVVTADELYALKFDDPEVFKIFNDGHFSGIFQFEGQAQRRVAADVLVKSLQEIDHVTALARPGPLGGGASRKYIARAAGREEVEYKHPSMASYLGDTMGVVLYQEQVMRICVELGQFDWKATSEIRKAMSGRKGKEYFDRRGDEFVAGAATIGVPEKDARVIWDEICTFGAWGMNRSHTVSYAIISYWCAWLKCYHRTAYFAACLRNAKDDTQSYEILREAHEEGVAYTPFDIDKSDVDWKVVDGELIGGFKNLDGFGPAKSVKAVEQRRLGTWTEAQREKILAAHVKFQELFPLHAAYGHIYKDPEAAGCATGSCFSKIDNLPPSGDVLMLCSVVRKELRDENETLRVARRDGRRLPGQTLFVDVFVTDDAGIPIMLRFDRFKFEPLGRVAAERLKPGDVLMVRGHRIPNFAMVKCKKVKCLNRPEVFDA